MAFKGQSARIGVYQGAVFEMLKRLSLATKSILLAFVGQSARIEVYQGAVVEM